MHERLLGIVLLGTVVFGWGCSRLPTVPLLAPGRTRGITLATWSPQVYGGGSTRASIDAIAGTGANQVVLLYTLYQKTLQANVMEADPHRTPTLSSMAVAAERAAGAGMEVAVKIHVDIDSGAWRGKTEPQDFRKWFANYGSHLSRVAAWCGSHGVGTLVIGTELAGTVSHEAQWRKLVALARQAFSGRIVYAASWDEARLVPFWDAVDLVGVDFYYPVARRKDAGRVEILAGWQAWLPRLERLHHATGKRILLTEIGYRSVDGAGMNPYAFGGGGTADPMEQADLYWAALAATSAPPWIEGLYWWNWPADGSGGLTNLDYSPVGKPAEEVLREAWVD